MSINDCHLSIETFWRCKCSGLHAPLGCTGSLSNRIQCKCTLWLLNEKDGVGWGWGLRKERRNLWSQERKHSMKNKQESLGWAVGVCMRKRYWQSRGSLSLEKILILDSWMPSYAFHGEYMHSVRNAGLLGELIKL
jgi:hypothetical protein